MKTVLLHKSGCGQCTYIHTLMYMHLLLWCLEQQFGDEDSMRDELQPGVGKACGTTRSHYVVHVAGGWRETNLSHMNFGKKKWAVDAGLT